MLKPPPLRRVTYVLLQEEFEELFGHYGTKSFDIIPHPLGKVWYLIATGEVFTVVEKPEVRDQLLRMVNLRAKEIKKIREFKKGIK